MHLGIAAVLLLTVAGCAVPVASHAAPPVAPTETPKPAAGLDTPIGDLMANPKTKQVLDRHLPKLAENSHYFMIEGMTLRQLAESTHGQLTAEHLAKLQAELAAAR